VARQIGLILIQIVWRMGSDGLRLNDAGCWCSVSVKVYDEVYTVLHRPHGVSDDVHDTVLVAEPL
jgi:hypothetical protein